MGKREKWGLLFNGHKTSVIQDEKSSEDWLHDKVNVLNTTEWHIRLKIMKMVNVIYTLLQLKNENILQQE